MAIGDANETEKEGLRLMDKRDSRGFLLLLELETQVRGQPMLGQKISFPAKGNFISFSQATYGPALTHPEGETS